MLGRLGSGVALAATAVLVLVGCAPGPPALTDDEAVSAARLTIERFYASAEDAYQQGQASAANFDGIATSDYAAEYASQIQSLLDEGFTSTGVPDVTNIELLERADEVMDFALCTDGTEVQTTTPEGETTGAVVAWSARFSGPSDAGGLLLADLSVSGDLTVCEP